MFEPTSGECGAETNTLGMVGLKAAFYKHGDDM